MASPAPARVVLGLALAAVLVATLAPYFGPSQDPTRPCLLLCGDQGLSDALVNVILYLPLGVALRLNGLRTGRAALAASALSALIESAQTLLPGRDPSAGDIVFNTVGAALGVQLVVAAAWWAAPPRGRRIRLVLAAALAAIAALAVEAWLLAPVYPDAEWYGHWTARLGHLAPYQGRVLAARLGGRALPQGEIPETDETRTALRNGEPLRVTFVAGPAPPDMAPVFHLSDRHRRSVVMIGVDGSDAILVIQQRAEQYRLHAPFRRFPDWMLAVAPGDTVEAVLENGEAGRCFRLGASRSCDLGVGAGRGWALFYWLGDGPRWLHTTLDVLWIGLLSVPLGLWFVRSAAWSAAAALLLGGLIAVPALTSLAPSGLPEFLGLAAGFELGLLTRRTIRRRAREGDAGPAG